MQWRVIIVLGLETKQGENSAAWVTENKKKFPEESVLQKEAEEENMNHEK